MLDTTLGYPVAPTYGFMDIPSYSYRLAHFGIPLLILQTFLSRWHRLPRRAGTGDIFYLIWWRWPAWSAQDPVLPDVFQHTLERVQGMFE